MMSVTELDMIFQECVRKTPIFLNFCFAISREPIIINGKEAGTFTCSVVCIFYIKEQTQSRKNWIETC